MTEMDGGDIPAALYADPDLRDIPFLFLTSLASPAELSAGRQEIGGRAPRFPNPLKVKTCSRASNL